MYFYVPVPLRIYILDWHSAHLAGQWRGPDGDLAQLLVVERQHPRVLRHELDLDRGQRVGGGEIPLGVPHPPASLHLVGHQLVAVVHLHGAVDYPV